MRETFSQSEKTTADVVLNILRERHLQQCYFDLEANSDVSLNDDSTIADWRDACDLVGWKPLGRALNHWLHIDHSDDEWHAVLGPKNKKLKDVCELIATTAIRPKIEPLKIGGEENLAAGFFIALRTALKLNQINVDTFRSSNTFNTAEDIDILDAVSMIAPQVLPTIECHESKFSAVIYRAFFIR